MVKLFPRRPPELLCQQNKEVLFREYISFKLLFIVDNALRCPPFIGGLYPYIKVFFSLQTPPFEPMDQGDMSAFKAYYLMRTFAQAIDTSEEDTQNTPDAILEGLQHL